MIRGKVHIFGDDIDTDVIIPAPYLVSSNPKELAQHAMEGADPDFPKKVKPGDIIVAGRNFGCGSSREHAPMALKGAGVACVIAKSFARIFYRNAFNTGLLILVSPQAAEEASTGDEIEVEPEKGVIRNITKGKEYHSAPVPPFMQELLNAGGLMNFMMKQVKNNG